jgi:hypothetical protein
MFNSTFFKFLITFALIVATSFLIMGIAGFFDSKINTDKNTQSTISK